MYDCKKSKDQKMKLNQKRHFFQLEGGRYVVTVATGMFATSGFHLTDQDQDDLQTPGPCL